MQMRNHVLQNTMVSSFALNYSFDDVLKMFQKMELEELKPNCMTSTSILSSYA